MKKIVYEDLYEFHMLSDVKLSPDGKRAIFMEHQADKAENNYTSRLWLLDVSTGAQRLLAERGGVKLAQWLNADEILFVSERGQDKMRAQSAGKSRQQDPVSTQPRQAGTVSLQHPQPASSNSALSQTEIYKISADGGEAGLFMLVPEKVSNISPLSPGRFLITVYSDALLEKGEDYYVVDELPFWFNGKGVINKKRTRLYIGEQDGMTCRLTPLTDGLTDVLSFAISADKSQIAAACRTFTDMSGLPSDLWVFDAATGTGKCLVKGGSCELFGPVFMEEGVLFYQEQPYEWAGRSPRFHLVNTMTGEAVTFDASGRNDGFGGNELQKLPKTSWVLELDRAVQNSVGTDAKYGGGKSMVYDDGRLYYLEANECDTFVAVLDTAGRRSYMNAVPGAVTGIDVKHGVFVMTAMRENRLAEIYSVCLEDGAETQLTHFNDGFLADHTVVSPEVFSYDSANGYSMKGFVLKPVDFDPAKKYPVILSMHGGPKVTFGTVFHHEMQCQAGEGYFVIYTNPRGSDGRGEDFANLTGKLGGPDFDDFMEFTQEACRRYPQMDERHIGICGGSYGGFMCNWMIGHTDRFAAAVSQRSIANYATKLLCTDIGFYHNKLQIGAYPWEDIDKVWAHSPLVSAHKAKTPTLFIQSDEDYRCYMSDAIQMYSALKRHGCQTRMILFHGENHELSRSGKPHNRITRLREMGRWFEEYLKV